MAKFTRFPVQNFAKNPEKNHKIHELQQEIEKVFSPKPLLQDATKPVKIQNLLKELDESFEKKRKNRITDLVKYQKKLEVLSKEIHRNTRKFTENQLKPFETHVEKPIIKEFVRNNKNNFSFSVKNNEKSLEYLLNLINSKKIALENQNSLLDPTIKRSKTSENIKKSSFLVENKRSFIDLKIAKNKNPLFCSNGKKNLSNENITERKGLFEKFIQKNEECSLENSKNKAETPVLEKALTPRTEVSFNNVMNFNKKMSKRMFTFGLENEQNEFSLKKVKIPEEPQKSPKQFLNESKISKISEINSQNFTERAILSTKNPNSRKNTLEINEKQGLLKENNSSLIEIANRISGNIEELMEKLESSNLKNEDKERILACFQKGKKIDNSAIFSVSSEHHIDEEDEGFFKKNQAFVGLLSKIRCFMIKRYKLQFFFKEFYFIIRIFGDLHFYLFF